MHITHALPFTPYICMQRKDHKLHTHTTRTHTGVRICTHAKKTPHSHRRRTHMRVCPYTHKEKKRSHNPHTCVRVYTHAKKRLGGSLGMHYTHTTCVRVRTRTKKRLEDSLTSITWETRNIIGCTRMCVPNFFLKKYQKKIRHQV